MKEINELSFPDDIRYAESHEWAKLEGDTVKIGITDYAQDQLGDIVFVEMPEAGETFEKGAEFGIPTPVNLAMVDAVKRVEHGRVEASLDNVRDI